MSLSGRERNEADRISSLSIGARGLRDGRSADPGCDDDGDLVVTDKHPHIDESLQKLAVPVESLTLDPANARKHPERNLETIKGSLERFGFRQPVVVQKQGMIVRAGNARVQVARAMGWTHVPAVIVDEADVEATAYAIADNRTSELAEWDKNTLASLLESLDSDTQEAAGWSGDELDELMEGLGEFSIDEADAPDLRSGDREPFQQMTFTLHDDQAESVRAAIDKAKDVGPFVGPNENGNGNALARIAEEYLA